MLHAKTILLTQSYETHNIQTYITQCNAGIIPDHLISTLGQNTPLQLKVVHTPNRELLNKTLKSFS